MEWGIVLSFALSIGATMLFEALWLKRKGWAGTGGSFAFSILTNAAGFTIGLFVIFVVFAGFLMLAFGGSLDKYPLNNVGLWITIVLALVFTPVFLMLLKRFFLFALKMEHGKSAWKYCAVSSFAGFLVSVAVPMGLGILLFKVF